MSLEERFRQMETKKLATKSQRADGRDLLGLDSGLNSTADTLWQYISKNGRLRFPNALQDWTGQARMLRECTMIAFMDAITDKPEWTRKIHDENIVNRWRAEASEQAKLQRYEERLTDEMFDYCLEELRDYAEAQEQSGFVPSVNADAVVYKSDTLISTALRKTLLTEAKRLEDIPEHKKDWHPNTNNIVLDLVHPSLFPLLYGRSLICREETVPLESCVKFTGKGEVMPVPEPGHMSIEHFSGARGGFGPRGTHYYSSRFQWLPCEVRFEGSEAAKVTSYINNLHPEEHGQLYHVIEEIIAKAVPMWDATLASTERSPDNSKTRFNVDESGWIDPKGQPPIEDDEGNEDENDEPAYARYEREEEWRRANRTLLIPDPRDYPGYDHPILHASSRRYRSAVEKERVGLRDLFAKEGLQVIVKMANIHLTPEKPEYGGGSWHIEGQLNEHICATALYYYDCENITDSFLSFRELMQQDDISMATTSQDDWENIERMYGVEQHGQTIQFLGKVNTRQGRLLTFPNVLQHRVEPFRLADPSRVGHRKILALFLVDPYCRIPSTANVPPQQKHWWREMVFQLKEVGNLPTELAEQIVDDVDGFPIDLEEAKDIRLELMEERKMFVKDVDSSLQRETFNFCEH